jgi:hypothetical protein
MPESLSASVASIFLYFYWRYLVEGVGGANVRASRLGKSSPFFNRRPAMM